jgi:hypothetical protein
VADIVVIALFNHTMKVVRVLILMVHFFAQMLLTFFSAVRVVNQCVMLLVALIIQLLNVVMVFGQKG